MVRGEDVLPQEEHDEREGDEDDRPAVRFGARLRHAGQEDARAGLATPAQPRGTRPEADDRALVEHASRPRCVLRRI